MIAYHLLSYASRGGEHLSNVNHARGNHIASETSSLSYLAQAQATESTRSRLHGRVGLRVSGWLSALQTLRVLRKFECKLKSLVSFLFYIC